MSTQKSTTLKILPDNNYERVSNTANFEPRKGDYITYKGQLYKVLYVEYDFDKAIMYITIE